MASSANALALVRVIGSQQFVYGLSDEIDRRITEGGVSAGVATFNTRSGAVTLTSGDVTTALTYTPQTPTQAAASRATVASTAQTADYTLALADAGTVVEANLGTAINITVPPNSSVAFPVGTVLYVCQIGAGVASLVAGAGVTLRNPHSTLGLRAQYSTVKLRQRATDVWVLDGDLA